MAFISFREPRNVSWHFSDTPVLPPISQDDCEGVTLCWRGRRGAFVPASWEMGKRGKWVPVRPCGQADDSWDGAVISYSTPYMILLSWLDQESDFSECDGKKSSMWGSSGVGRFDCHPQKGVVLRNLSKGRKTEQLLSREEALTLSLVPPAPWIVTKEVCFDVHISPTE